MTQEIPEEVQERASIDLSDGIPDWASGSTHFVLDEDTICDELGIDRSKIPRERAIVAHAKSRSNISQIRGKMVVRIECRIGGEWGNPIQEPYDASELTDNQYHIMHSNEKGDPTYTDFFFELPEGIVEKTCKIVREDMEG